MVDFGIVIIVVVKRFLLWFLLRLLREIFSSNFQFISLFLRYLFIAFFLGFLSSIFVVFCF